jgi:hypothetical protein
MDQDLRDVFGKAVADEPVPLGDITRDAMATGTRIRRRRRLLAGSAAAIALVAVLGAVNLVPRTASAPAEPAAPPAMMLPLSRMQSEGCHVSDGGEAAELVMFLKIDITDAERAELERRLSEEASLESLAYETRENAYERFTSLWADSPDLVDGVTPEQLPESFRLRLTDDRLWGDLVRRYGTSPGVDEILGQVCTGTPE